MNRLDRMLTLCYCVGGAGPAGHHLQIISMTSNLGVIFFDGGVKFGKHPHILMILPTFFGFLFHLHSHFFPLPLSPTFPISFPYHLLRFPPSHHLNFSLPLLSSISCPSCHLSLTPPLLYSLPLPSCITCPSTPVSLAPPFLYPLPHPSSVLCPPFFYPLLSRTKNEPVT